MRRICIAVAIAAALVVPSTASAARTAWMKPLSRTTESTARMSGQLAVFARARAGVKATELPRTGADPGLIALAGAGLALAGAGIGRVRSPI